MISENSRYHDLPLRKMKTSSGKEISYLARRFIPPQDAVSIAGFHTVTPAERLDIIAHNSYGDATQFWRIADYALTLKPSTLTQRPGRRLAIPMVGPSFVPLPESEEGDS
ncbi:hypothetical protein N9W89_07705 [Hellea sp.]|nr:hypothetical protein [Hellea sp.]